MRTMYIAFQAAVLQAAAAPLLFDLFTSDQHVDDYTTTEDFADDKALYCGLL